MLPLLILNPHCLPSEPLFFLLDYDGYHRMSRAGNSFSWLSVGILKWVSAKQVQDFSTFFPSHSHADTEEGKRGTGPNIKCCSVTQLCPTLWDPMDYSMPGFHVLHYLPEFESVMSSSHFILCHPLLLLPSVFPSIRVFSSESALCIKWPKYQSFSFSIKPSNEYSELISFRIDWFALLAI